ncbi:unnamed protein product, partial [Vicia faba]
MADPARDEQNVRVADTNNGTADKNGHLDNPGDPGHSTIPVTTAPGTSSYRDEATASSSPLPPPLEDDPTALAHYRAARFHEVPVPAGADATTQALFAAINQTNYLIFAQGERLRALEDDRRPPRRHQRPHSPPPRVTEVRHPSPPRRHYRENSRSPSPRPKQRRPYLERQPVNPAGEPSRDLARHDKRHAGDGRVTFTQRASRSRETQHDHDRRARQCYRSPSLSPERSDEDDPRGPLSQVIMDAPIPPGMEKPPHLKEYDGVADPVDHIDGFEAMLHYHNVGGPI